MGTSAGRIFFALVLIATFGTAGLLSAQAAVPRTTHHAVIDSTQSTVTLQPGLFFTLDGSEPPQPITMGISGTFDIEISEWEWEPIGGITGPFQPPPVRETWVDFKNPDFVLSEPGFNFEFPDYMVPLSNTGLGGSSHPCDFPSPPVRQCTCPSSLRKAGMVSRTIWFRSPNSISWH